MLTPGFLKAAAAPSTVLPGIDVLARQRFRPLWNKRVGLLTHPAGVNRAGQSTVNVLQRAAEVRLVALFGPEHGIYGNEKANVPVDDKIDPRTGLPVFSLYGKFRRPTAAMLDLIDTIVIDLQDIGSRSYTYVSCMRYVIEEAFKARKEVIVLDRPNPLGGLKTDGPPLEEQWMSYVGAFRVPYVHGLTIGELANYAHKASGVLQIDSKIRRQGQLSVIPMQGWRRHMLWTDTGLRWIPTSPAIPDLSAAAGYPMTGLGTQLGAFTHGYGTRYPFRLLQFPGIAPETIAANLTARRIAGVGFKILSFRHRNQTRRGCYVEITDWQALQPTELSLHMMALACQWSDRNPFSSASSAQQGLFLKHLGDSTVLEALQNNGPAIPIDRFLNQWKAYNQAYRAAIAPFLLYR